MAACLKLASEKRGEGLSEGSWCPHLRMYPDFCSLLRSYLASKGHARHWLPHVACHLSLTHKDTSRTIRIEAATNSSSVSLQDQMHGIAEPGARGRTTRDFIRT